MVTYHILSHSIFFLVAFITMNHHEFHDPCALLKQVTPAVKRQVVSLTLVELENLTRPRGGTPKFVG